MTKSEIQAETETHVVLGAGQVGPILAEKLVARGHDVRVVSRTQPRPIPGVRWMSADLTNLGAAREAVRGATTVYHCANPMRYDQWETLLPPLSRTIRDAVAGSGARLVVLDNLYMYGAPEGGVIRDDTKQAPQSRKGELRARLAEEFFESQQRGDFELSVLRAPDFFGLHAARSATFHPIFFRRLARGKAAPVLGDPDVPHAHAYIPDVAEALFRLGTRPQPSTSAWLAPATWNGTVRDLFAVFARVANRSLTPWQVPSWLWPVLGLWDSELRAVPEMLHQWNAPMMLDDSRFRRVFGFEPTPIERAVEETVAAHGILPVAERLQPEAV
jgi:nucleoside-diphosphate-sugar epimerase